VDVWNSVSDTVVKSTSVASFNLGAVDGCVVSVCTGMAC